jgi:hypothetical protein
LRSPTIIDVKGGSVTTLRSNGRWLIGGVALAFATLTVGGAPGLGGDSDHDSAYDAAAVDSTAAIITPDTMGTHVAYLASDELEGRDTPSAGLEMAATYIADQFKSFGLEPIRENESYVQRWPLERATLQHDAISLTYQNGKEIRSLEYGVDFFVIPADQGQVEGAIVYVGTAPNLRGGFPAEVKGKIAMVYIPPAGPGEDFDPQRMARAAADSGALAFILVFPPAITEQVVAANVAETKTNQPFLGVPFIGLLYDGAERLLGAGGLDWDALEQEDAAPTEPLDLAGISVTLQVPLERTHSEPPNVIAWLPGAHEALRDTYVVYTAHFDALGLGKPDNEGDSIYNGANDNASGVAALLEVARAFASLSHRPARSLIFLAVSGEEIGFLGSRHFVLNPPVPVAQLVANLNIECLARGEEGDVYAISEEYAKLGSLSRQIIDDHPSMRLTDEPDMAVGRVLGFRSDHGSFAESGIPFLMFGGGMSDDYHSPSDEIEHLNFDRAARLARLYFTLGTALAADPSPPSWKPGALEHVQESIWWF